MKSGVLSIVAALGFIGCSSLVAQESSPPGKRQTFQTGGDNAVVIGELGVIISLDGEKLTVKALLPSPKDPKEVPVDIAIGDEIAMTNGKRVRSIGELKELYESTPVGNECKLGVRREGQPHIVTFLKKEAKDFPQKMIVRRQGNDDHGDFFPALGIGIAERGSDVIVSNVLPNAPKEISKGDVLKTLNNKRISKASDFSKEFDATNVGGKLVLGLERDGKAFTISTTRPKPKMQVITK
ncbi:MAG: PDZ domain-containing protein [Bacteroidota bacterium]